MVSQASSDEMDLSRIREFFECPVCCEQLRDRSKVLPCQHTICKECLENWFDSKGYLQCPECRTDYRGLTVDCLSPNVFLERMMNEISKKAENNKPVPTLWKWQGVGSSQKQPCAKALYNFQGTEDGDLSFAKGDLILLSDILDKNWFEGVLDGKSGVVPANFVKVLVPFPSFDDVSKQEPLARGLYDFNEGRENSLIEFKKGDIISVIKRIDSNWCEGVFMEQHGIFPFNYVELNAAAEVLVSTSESSDEEDDSPSQRRDKSPTPSKEQNLRARPEPPKRHSIHVDNPEEQMMNRTRQLLDFPVRAPRNRDRRASETSLQDSLNGFTAGRSVTNGHPDRAAEASNSNVNGASARESHREAPARINHPEAGGTLYICMYDYRAKKVDELSLVRGEVYCVKEKYRDGWCKGYRVRSTTKRTGMFPGNYLKPASNHRIHLSRCLSYNPATPSPANYLPNRLNVPQHSHSTSAPSDLLVLPRNGSSQTNWAQRTQAPGGRTRSGSEPTDPSLAARTTERSRVRSFIRKLKKKQAVPAPIPLPYYSEPSTEFRPQRPIPILPSEPPPPYSPPPYSPPATTYLPPPRSPIADVPPTILQNYDRYRAIFGFPPQSDYELELKAGDIVYVIKKREDGWYHGKSQRTGKVGLFPASFVGSC
ncbi:E3 ubiquitin-protein ligase SH3RF1-like [Rhopilema esculentum]|uniref:E3 ubiquitin-protein ligase SH3RF1-like n=1 Tax=Rhopilema esculentum TaxID=499914 RepID=UPI0031D82A31